MYVLLLVIYLLCTPKYMNINYATTFHDKLKTHFLLCGC